MKKVILINGLPRAGKDTVADFLVHNYDYTKMSFATPLKEVIAGTFGISLELLDMFKNNPKDHKLFLDKKEFIDFRQILQNFGTVL